MPRRSTGCNPMSMPCVTGSINCATRISTSARSTGSSSRLGRNAAPPCPPPEGRESAGLMRPSVTASGGRFFLRRLRFGPTIDFRNDGWVRQRGGVTQRAVLCHVTQQPAHDLPGARLRELWREHDVGRSGNLAVLLSDVLTPPD